MRAKDLYANLDWTDEFKGQCVIYVMRYQDKNYVGSSAGLRSKIHTTRYYLTLIGVTKCAIRILEVVDPSNRDAREEFYVKKLKTLAPLGHNKTPSGRGSIRGSVLEKQGDGHPSIFKSATWASPVTGKCVLYVLEYASKRYVGTTLGLCRRIEAHRRTLARRGITEGYVIHYEEIPIAEMRERESAGIESWDTYAPAGHNKTKNGAGAGVGSDSATMKKHWEDPAYRLNQTLKRKAMWEDPAHRLNHTLKMKAKWEDPTFRLSQSLKYKAGHARRRESKK